MALFLPVVLAVGGLSLLIGVMGSESAHAAPLLPSVTERKKSVARSDKALAKKDWQAAVVEALASRSETQVKRVVAALQKAGLKVEADSLLAAWAALKNEMRAAQADKKPAAKSSVKPAAKPAAKPRVAEVRPTPDKPAARVAPPKPKKPALTPEAKQATEMAQMLVNATRYKEDQAMVKAYQVANGLTADGKYGPGTARSLWATYQIIPPNPYYWSSVSSRNPGLISDYDKFLQSIISSRPASAGRINEMRKVLGK